MRLIESDRALDIEIVDVFAEMDHSVTGRPGGEIESVKVRRIDGVIHFREDIYDLDIQGEPINSCG